jgi:hypothetical protein
MVEPFSLAAIGGLALTEGIKFLYAQAGELFKRRREQAAAGQDAEPLAVDTTLPPSLGGTVLRTGVSPSFVDTHQQRLAELRSGLANYADDTLPVDPADPGLTATVDELRSLLEDAFGRRLTFVGETGREPSGTVVRGAVRATETVNAQVTGVEADEVTSGAVEGTVDVNTAYGGTLTGAKVGRVGPGRPTGS